MYVNYIRIFNILHAINKLEEDTRKILGLSQREYKKHLKANDDKISQHPYNGKRALDILSMIKKILSEPIKLEEVHSSLTIYRTDLECKNKKLSEDEYNELSDLCFDQSLTLLSGISVNEFLQEADYLFPYIQDIRERTICGSLHTYFKLFKIRNYTEIPDIKNLLFNPLASIYPVDSLNSIYEIGDTNYFSSN